MAALTSEVLFFDWVSYSVPAHGIVMVWCLILESNTPNLQMEYFCSDGEIPEYMWTSCGTSSNKAEAPAMTWLV